ncbi:MAG: hypothetical protein QNJ72_26370 [Pleurocapsa sp. MO_226.B13]|nr:hypothetical protein [Pleurocapsa sp. MO_226.B13]
MDSVGIAHLTAHLLHSFFQSVLVAHPLNADADRASIIYFFEGFGEEIL